MLQIRSLALSMAMTSLGLSSMLAQSTARSLDVVTNWPAPLYWQPAQSLAPDGSRNIRTESLKPEAFSSTLGVPAIFVAVTPCRLMDTRTGQGFSGPFGPPVLAGNSARTVPVPASNCGVPAAVAYSLNITAVPSAGTRVGYVKAWPDDQTQPNTAVLTDVIAGAIVGNSAIVPSGADGGIHVLAQTSTDLVVDINGYFALPSSLPFAGTAAAPALTFGDTATGLFSTGPDSISVSTGGVSALTIGADGNLEMRGSITKGGSLFLHNLGSDNAAAGLNALAQHGGSGNTALGVSALQGNSGGVTNTAVGLLSLRSNATGNDNTAIGAISLGGNTTGFQNTATGRASLGANTTGNDNTGTGYGTLASNLTGNNNTAVGVDALGNMTGGRDNTALGAGAGAGLASGSYNILIYNLGTSTDNGVIRIGSSNQTSTFIAGIRSATTGQPDAIPIVIDSNGQFGTVSSSRRVKRDIADLGDVTSTLMSLRPVQFRYSAYGSDSPLQYGLIAEEVAAAAPGLVARKANGEVETVYYDKVNAMLLSLVQKQQRTIEDLKRENGLSQSRMATYDLELQTLQDQVTTLTQDSSSKPTQAEGQRAE